MYAVIEAGGKQYRVAKGERLRVEKIGADEGAKVTFPVLLIANGEQVKVGQPRIAGAEVTGVVKGHELGEKLTIYKFARRKGYRRKTGHRQQYTSVLIEDIKG
jgi:large subunit ribosomal protein L21